MGLFSAVFSLFSFREGKFPWSLSCVGQLEIQRVFFSPGKTPASYPHVKEGSFVHTEHGFKHDFNKFTVYILTFGTS